ncbi:MAG: TerB family tellurite resistance protein [Myxococcota bacterium]
MLFGSKVSVPREGALERVVRQHMPEADDDLRALVVAVAGLAACVAFADGVFDAREKEQVLEELRRLHVLAVGGAEAIGALLEQEIEALTAGGDQAWARVLKEGMAREGRLDVLDALVEIAAADDVLSTPETNWLRRITTKLALEEADYLALQAKHRDKLAVLREDG